MIGTVRRGRLCDKLTAILEFARTEKKASLGVHI